MKNRIIEFIRNNKKSIIVFSIFILIGLISGIISFHFLSSEVLESLNSRIVEILDVCKQEGFKGISILKNGLQNNLLLYIVLILSSFIIVLPFIICIICIIKGFAIGSLIMLLIHIFGHDSVLYILYMVVIPNSIYIPCLLYCIIEMINFYYNSNSLKERSILTHSKLFLKFIFTVPFVIVGIFIEQIMFNLVINMYIG